MRLSPAPAALLALLALAMALAGAAAAQDEQPFSEPDLFDNRGATPVDIPAAAPQDGIPSIAVSLGEDVAVSLPPDRGPRFWIYVKNTGSTYLALRFAVYCVESCQALPGWPQPNILYLAPGQTQGVMTFMDDLWGRLVDLGQGVHERTARFDFIVAAESGSPFVTFPTARGAPGAKEVPQASFLKKCGVTRTTWSALPRPVTLKGSVRGAGSAAGAEVMALVGSARSLSTAVGLEGAFSLALPAGRRFVVRAHAQGCDDAYAVVFSRSDRTVDFSLSPRRFTGAYTVEEASSSPPGFWRGASAPGSGRCIAVQGMENWKDEGWKKSSQLMMLDFGGKVHWKFPMGWEAWGADISGDGKYAACVTMPRTEAGHASILTLLDGATGAVFWFRDITRLHSSRPDESREVRISPGNRYVALGTGMGQLLLLTLRHPTVTWAAFCGGQVRKLRFIGGDAGLLAGSGDGNLYRFETATGKLLWKTYVWGWAFTEGIDVTRDEKYIAVGTKNGYVSVLEARTGKRLWSENMHEPVHHVEFSPAGDRVVAGSSSTRMMKTATGEILWQAGASTSGAWLANGRFLVIADRIAAVFTAEGTLIAVPSTTEGHATFTGVSESGRQIVLATDRGEIVALEGDVRQYREGDDEWIYP